MTEGADSNWEVLLARLESDVRERVAESGGASADVWAWEEMDRRIRHYADVLLHGRTDLDVSAVQDIAQGVLLKLQRPETLKRVRASRSPGGYRATIIRNAANDIARRQRTERESFARLGFELIRTPSAAEQPPETMAALPRELARLSLEDRELLRLRFWRNLSIGQIAEELHISYSAAAVRLFRILRRLRDRLASEGDSREET